MYARSTPCPLFAAARSLVAAHRSGAHLGLYNNGTGVIREWAQEAGAEVHRSRTEEDEGDIAESPGAGEADHGRRLRDRRAQRCGGEGEGGRRGRSESARVYSGLLGGTHRRQYTHLSPDRTGAYLAPMQRRPPSLSQRSPNSLLCTLCCVESSPGGLKRTSSGAHSDASTSCSVLSGNIAVRLSCLQEAFTLLP